jgi:vacuolar-type H+-ATPase subunit H
MVYDEIARIKFAENEALNIVSQARKEAERLFNDARKEAAIIKRNSEERGLAEVQRIRAESQRIAEMTALKIREEGEEDATVLREESETKLGEAAKHIVNRITGTSDVLPFRDV